MSHLMKIRPPGGSCSTRTVGRTDKRHGEANSHFSPYCWLDYQSHSSFEDRF